MILLSNILLEHSKFVKLAPLLLMLLVFVSVETQVHGLLAKSQVIVTRRTLSFLTAEYKVLFSGDLTEPHRADPTSI